MKLEFHQLDRRWEHLRVRHPQRQRRLLASLATIRSLAYFLPVIDEVLSLHLNPDYFRYLRQKVERAIQAR